MRRGASNQSYIPQNQQTVVKPPIPPKPLFEQSSKQLTSQISVNQETKLLKHSPCNPYKKEKFNSNEGHYQSDFNIKEATYTFQNDHITKPTTQIAKISTNNKELPLVSVEYNALQGQALYGQPNHALKQALILPEKFNGIVRNYNHINEPLKKKYDNHTPDSLITINQSIVSINSDNKSAKTIYVDPVSNSTVTSKNQYIYGNNTSINGIATEKQTVSNISITTGINTLYNMEHLNPQLTQNGYIDNSIMEKESQINKENLIDGFDVPDNIGPIRNNDLAMSSNTYIYPQQPPDESLDSPLLENKLYLEKLNQVNTSINKPTLEKTDAIEIDENYDKKLSRGISRATDNLPLVSKARSELAQGIWDSLESALSKGKSPYFVETPLFTFTLPDLSVYSDNFRIFLEKDLVETATLVSLETAERLNWWASIGASQRLWPLATTGDGNCLLHAASLGMWGFHDRLLTLRNALHEFLTKSQYSQPLWRRWRWQLAMQNRKTGLVYSPAEWEDEWQNLIRLASSKPRSENGCHGNDCDSVDGSTWSSISEGKLNGDGGGHVYESLEEIHVLALSHVLRRPIIVVADITLKDVNGAPLAPIPFGGIYLPLECPPKECQKSPLLLTYDAAHFSALVVMETPEQSNLSQLPAVIPVIDNHHELLPIQFLIDPGEDFGWGKDEYDPIFIDKLMITQNDQRGVLSEYLNLIQVPIPSTYLDTTPYFNTEEIGVVDTMHDIDKKSSESSFDSDDGRAMSDSGAMKAKPKQIHTVVKQFGSIGRSMSKRIKKNLNTLSKLSRNGSFRKNRTKSENLSNKAIRISSQQSFILGAEIHIEKRQAYQEEMIKNYLSNAKKRFKEPSETLLAEIKPDVSLEIGSSDGVQCVNSGCTLFATAETSYLCSICYQKQKLEEEQEYKSSTNMRSPNTPLVSCPTQNLEGSVGGHRYHHQGPQYGAGKSTFYADLDNAAIKTASQIPVTNSVYGHKDQTLYLSNSVFYNDTNLSIPSYNLSKSKNSIAQQDSGASRNISAHPSSKSNVYLSTNSGSSNKQVSSIAPISIDGSYRTDVLRQSPKCCLSSSCEFFGNPSMDGYCSKCYVKKKSSTKSLYVEQKENTLCK